MTENSECNCDTDSKPVSFSRKNAERGEPVVEVLKVPDDLEKWHLVHQFLNVRAAVFVQGLGWDLAAFEGIGEFEQYDTFATIYVVAHQDDKVVGGARLVRTDNRNGVYSYMIKDACAGLLPGMPTNLCNDSLPSASTAWELTRFFSNDSATTVRLLEATDAFLRSRGASECLILGSPAFPRRARMLGYELKAIGPVVENDDCRFQAFSYRVH